VSDKPNHKLACFELWGGNRRVAHPVELPGLAGWVYSAPFEPARGGGDVHYISVCSRGMVSRIALADVAGHGQSVSGVAERLHDVFQKHSDSWDQSALMRELNDAFLEGAVGVRYATAAVLGFYRQTGELLFTNAGHPPALWYHMAEKKWDWLEDKTPYAKEVKNLPLGLIAGTNYAQTAVELALDDLLVLYTDGITEARDETGNQLGRDRLLHLARELPRDSPLSAGQALLVALRAFRGSAPAQDDETLLVLQRVTT